MYYPFICKIIVSFVIAILLGLIPFSPLHAQQIADSAFHPPIEKPAYTMGKGPIVLIDETHNNFHTVTGRYLPFAELLRRDGYMVKAATDSLTPKSLQIASVFVTVNARKHFKAEEINNLNEWVRSGGSLLLIADHPPFSESAAELGQTFGIQFHQATVYKDRTGRLVFRRSEGTLLDHKITQGIDSIATFTGSSFRLSGPGKPLLLFGPEVKAYQESDSSEVMVQGEFQGAVLEWGYGRVAVFGEAAMFSAQLSGPNRNPMGMNAEIAKQNPRFLLNLMHWLTRLL